MRGDRRERDTQVNDEELWTSCKDELYNLSKANPPSIGFPLYTLFVNFGEIKFWTPLKTAKEAMNPR